MSRLCIQTLVLVSFACQGVRVSFSDDKDILQAHKQTDAPCDRSAPENVSRSGWCEREGQIDELITFSQIRPGYGVCLFGQCYDGGSLREWLQRRPVLPHDNLPFKLHWLDELLAFDAKGHVTAVALGPRGLLMGMFDGSVQLNSAESGLKKQRFYGHTDSIESVQFSPSGWNILTTSLDGTSRVWSTGTGVELHRFQVRGSTISPATFSANGNIVAWADSEGVWLWYRVSDKVKHVVYSRNITAFALSPSGEEVLVILRGRDHMNKVYVKDAQSGETKRSFPTHRADVHTLACSPDGAKVVTASEDKTAKIFDIETGRLLAHIIGHTSFILSAVFSPDGSKVLTNSGDNTARLWDARTGEQLQLFGGDDTWVRSMSMSPDGEKLAVAIGGLANILDVHD